jgi:hypothetical protein
MILATQISSLVISLWPLLRTFQFDHFFNQHFLGAYGMLRTVLGMGFSDVSTHPLHPGIYLWWKYSVDPHWGANKQKPHSHQRAATEPRNKVIDSHLLGIWILTRIFMQFCYLGLLWFYRTIQEVKGIGCSYKLPFIDYQLSASIELCTSLILFLYTLFENLKMKRLLFLARDT